MLCVSSDIFQDEIIVQVFDDDTIQFYVWTNQGKSEEERQMTYW